MKINSILSTKSGEVITVAPDQIIREALALLAQHNIGALVVVDKNAKVIGILSERDVVRMATKRDNVSDMQVKDVMTKDVIVGVPQDDLMTVANTMTENRFRHLPIVDGDRLIGIVSIGDVLKAQRDQYQGEIDTLETHILANDS